MTTVVFRELRDRVEIAFDSQVSAGYRKNELEGQGKVFKVGPVTIGGAGAVGYINQLADMHIPPIQSMSDTETDRWVQQVLIPKIKMAATMYSPYTRSEGQVAGIALIAVNGRVYEIGGDFSKIRVSGGNYAIGSGSSYALGALSSGKTAKEAVGIAAQHDMATGYTIRELIIKK